MVDRVRSGEWLFWFSLVAATLLHIQLAYLLLTYSPQKTGAIQIPTAAITINLEASDVLDAVDLSTTLRRASSGMPGENAEKEPEKLEPKELEPAYEPEPVEEEPKPKPAEDEPEHEPVEEKPEPEPVEEKPEPKPEPEPRPEPQPEPEPIEEEPLQNTTLQQAEDALERAMLEEIKRREEAERDAQKRRKEHDRLVKKRPEQPERKRRQRTTQSGGGGDRGSDFSRGRVSATTGSISNYASSVRARIARNKPGSGGRRGTVVVSLSVSTTGSLQSVRVVRSSGNGAIDNLALSAVRRSAPFPRPPAGARAGQLSFSIPFSFQ
jgi:TonB family protein